MTLIDYLTSKVRYYRLFTIASPHCVWGSGKYYFDSMNPFTICQTNELIHISQPVSIRATMYCRTFTLQCRTFELQIPIAVLLNNSVLESRGFVPWVL